jgi:pimeloyl-ACP methyl ester carboxylesterase
MGTNQSSEVRYLRRAEGRIAYTVEGSGPLVVAIPGMGDLRSTYRELIGPIVAAGYRVAAMDLRGHGDSDVTFRRHGDEVTGEDALALIAELGGPAVLLGNSMGGSAAAWAAAEDAEAVSGLVLFSPLLREPALNAPTQALVRILYRVVLRKPWGPRFWAGFYTRLNSGGTTAPWLAEHTAEIRRSLREPGRLRSFRELALQLDHRIVEERLGKVVAPITAFIGESDPDFRDPRAEVEWIAGSGAHAELVASAGHYVQAQRPDVVLPATLAFLSGLRDASGSWPRTRSAGATPSAAAGDAPEHAPEQPGPGARA